MVSPPRLDRVILYRCMQFYSLNCQSRSMPIDLSTLNFCPIYSPVEMGFDPEEIRVEANLVSKNAEFCAGTPAGYSKNCSELGFIPYVLLT